MTDDATQKSFLDRLAAAWPPEQWSELTVVVAVSGGADSVALLCGLAAIRYTGPGRLVAAHCQHGLRGEAAERDARFVEALAQRLGVECRIGRVDVRRVADDVGDGIESAARQARYEFLIETARDTGARLVATAHTADDQAETVLHHILRGTGLAGLAGMRPVRSLAPDLVLIRPLLSFYRAELETYLAAIGQPFCEDETNRDTRLTRNRIRHNLLPELATDFNPQVRQALVRLGTLAGEAQDFVDSQVDRLLSPQIVACDANRATVFVRPLEEVSDFLLRELFVRIWQQMNWPRQSMGHAEWKSLAQLTRGPSGWRDAAPEPIDQRTFPGGITASRVGERLVLIGPAA